MRSCLSKRKTTKAMAILLALTLALTFAMPVMAAEGQAGIIQTVIIEVDQNTLVEVNVNAYGKAYATKDALYIYLKGANEQPKIVALKGDGKRVDFVAYATNYAEKGNNVAAALAQTPELNASTLAKVKELVSFNPVTGEPELKPIEPYTPSGEMTLEIEASKTELTQNAQGTAGVDITAKVVCDGVVVDNIAEMGVVNFVSTLPNLTQIQGTLEKGKTTIGFVPIQVQQTVMVKITATVANSPIPNLNTKSADFWVKVNPISGETEIVTKNTITAVNATMADRVTLYFKAADFNVNKLNPADFSVNNRSNPAEVIPVKGFIQHPVNPEAVIAVLNVGAVGRAMHDNSRHELVVSRGGFFENAIIPFDLEDTDHLSVISAVGSDQLTVEVTFSEPVLDGTKVFQPNNVFRADDPEKYSIDGVRLSNIPGVFVTVGEAIVDPQPVPAKAPFNTIKADDRHKVTIKLPVSYGLSAGQHTLQISNVGEYASTTDNSNRLITQTLTFVTTVNDVKPQAYLTQLSPEQILVTFNKALKGNPTFVQIANATATAGAGNSQVTLTPGLFGTAKTFTVTPISQADAKAYQNPAFPSAVGAGYLIELNSDWTVIYDTAVTNVNYWTSTVNPYTLRIDDIEDLFGNAPVTGGVNGRQDITYSIARDQVGPVLTGIREIAGLKYLVKDLADQAWLVDVDEPVQIPTVTLPGVTPSQAQTLARPGDPVPQPEIEFSKGDKQVEGTIQLVNLPDRVFTIAPNTALDEAGTWQVSIINITDDVGNSQDTKVFNVVIKDEATTTDPKVIWADAHWNTKYIVDYDDSNDWVHVKFNKDMSILGTRSILRTQNWTIQGYDLPVSADIVAGIPFVLGTQYDSITIKLPKNWLRDKTGGDVFVNHRDLEDTQGNILKNNRINLVELVPGAAVASEAEFVAPEYKKIGVTIPVHMPAGIFNNSLAVTANGSYIYGHGAVMQGGNALTIGTGADINVTVRDIYVPTLNINVGKGSVNLINVQATNLNIISAGPNSVTLNGGYFANVNITDSDLRVLMTSDAFVAALTINAGKKVKLDSANTIIVMNLIVNGEVEMRSQSGALLTDLQIAQRVSGLAGAGTLTGAPGVTFATALAAIGGAPVVVDKTALNAAILQANAKVEADYTAESWAPFKAALDAAKDVSSTNRIVTQAEVNAALEALNDAMGALVKVSGTDPAGTWTAEETYAGAMTKDFKVNVSNLAAATHFELYVSGTKIGSRVAIDGKVTGLAMLFSDPSLSSVKFYDSQTATTPIATAICNADGKLSF